MMQQTNPLRSIGYGQERLHTGLVTFLADLHKSGSRRPLEGFLSAIGAPVGASASVRSRFEWHKADLTVCCEAAGRSRIMVFEFKVDSAEGGFFGPDQDKQTVTLARTFEQEAANERLYFYVTLGNGEFAGPPASSRFRWVRLDRFREAVAGTGLPHPALGDWHEILGEEQQRREGAPSFASQGKLSPEWPEVRDAGYRSGGVPLGVYGAMIREWEAGGYSKRFGTCRAYVVGRAPDCVLNFWDSWMRSEWFYFEINLNGTLNLKIEKGNLCPPSWDAVVRAADTTRVEGVRGKGRQEPRKMAETNTLYSWNVGLWEEASSPARVVRRVAAVLESCEPPIAALKEG